MLLSLNPVSTLSRYLARASGSAVPSPRRRAETRKQDFESPTKTGERVDKKSAHYRDAQMVRVRQLDWELNEDGTPRDTRASSTATPQTKVLVCLAATEMGWEPKVRLDGANPAAIAGALVAHRRGYRRPITADKVSLWRRQIEAGEETPLPRGRPPTWIDQVGEDKFLRCFRDSHRECYWATLKEHCAACRGGFELFLERSGPQSPPPALDYPSTSTMPWQASRDRPTSPPLQHCCPTRSAASSKAWAQKP